MDDKHWLSLHPAKRLSCYASLLTVPEDGQNNRNLSLSAVPDVSAETCADELRRAALEVDMGTVVRQSCGE